MYSKAAYPHKMETATVLLQI